MHLPQIVVSFAPFWYKNLQQTPCLGKADVQAVYVYSDGSSIQRT